MPRIAIQGIPGSFHHMAALQLFGPEETEILPLRYFTDIPRSLQEGTADLGLMAIENSTAGSILPNYMLINDHDLRITAEVYINVRHQLMVLPGVEMNGITQVWSHPMALLQCNRFFRSRPGLVRIEYEDTAAAARDIARQGLRHVAAIAPALAARTYGLHILEKDIQDEQHNATRFVLLTTAKPAPEPGADKISLRIEADHRPGSLLRLLEIMAGDGWNLTKLQSVPIPERRWEYAFFTDALFDPVQGPRDTVEKLRRAAKQVKILGIYKNRNI